MKTPLFSLEIVEIRQKSCSGVSLRPRLSLTSEERGSDYASCYKETRAGAEKQFQLLDVPQLRIVDANDQVGNVSAKESMAQAASDHKCEDSHFAGLVSLQCSCNVAAKEKVLDMLMLDYPAESCRGIKGQWQASSDWLSGCVYRQAASPESLKLRPLRDSGIRGCRVFQQDSVPFYIRLAQA